MSALRPIAPPHDADAECAALAAAWVDPAAAAVVVGRLGPDDFHDAARRRLFECFSALVGEGRALEPATVRLWLRQTRAQQGGAGPDAAEQALAECTVEAVTAAHVDATCAALAELGCLRRALRDARRAALAVRDGAPATQVAAMLREAAERATPRAAGRQGAVSLGDMLFDQSTELERRAADPDASLPGLRTGVAALDNVLGRPVAPAHMVFVAGRPSSGKTSLVLQILINWALGQVPVLFFSLETTLRDLTPRLLACHAGVDVATLLRPTAATVARYHQACADLYRLPLHVDDAPNLTVPTLRAKCEAHRLKHGLGAVAIDYIQLMQPHTRAGERDRRVAVEEASRGIKVLAKEFDVPFLIVAQLNRGPEGRGTSDHRPRSADLREAGQLEQDGDHIWMTYREQMYDRDADPRLAEIIVTKHKNGPTGVATVSWDGPCFRFRDPGEVDPYAVAPPANDAVAEYDAE